MKKARYGKKYPKDGDQHEPNAHENDERGGPSDEEHDEDDIQEYKGRVSSVPPKKVGNLDLADPNAASLGDCIRYKKDADGNAEVLEVIELQGEDRCED